MSYCVYITRAESWLDASSTPIAEDEWLAVVASDATLVVNKSDYVDRRLPDGTIQRSHPVEWMQADDDNRLWWSHGAIECKNPSARWRGKMIELAARLHARVLGEEDEEYR